MVLVAWQRRAEEQEEEAEVSAAIHSVHNLQSNGHQTERGRRITVLEIAIPTTTESVPLQAGSQSVSSQQCPRAYGWVLIPQKGWISGTSEESLSLNFYVQMDGRPAKERISICASSCTRRLHCSLGGATKLI